MTTLTLTLALLVSAPMLHAQTASPVQSQPAKGTAMTHRAAGPFDVKLLPQTPEPAGAGGDGIGRMLLDKRFHGALDATSKGQMLALRTATEGSAGYVAMELVTGKLDGRAGTFVLQHSGTMHRGAQQLTLTVVPDSATGELTGLSGSMAIVIAEGKHRYEFDYRLPAAAAAAADKPR